MGGHFHIFIFCLLKVVFCLLNCKKNESLLILLDKYQWYVKIANKGSLKKL